MLSNYIGLIYFLTSGTDARRARTRLLSQPQGGRKKLLGQSLTMKPDQPEACRPPTTAPEGLGLQTNTHILPPTPAPPHTSRPEGNFRCHSSRAVYLLIGSKLTKSARFRSVNPRTLPLSSYPELRLQAHTNTLCFNKTKQQQKSYFIFSKYTYIPIIL